MVVLQAVLGVPISRCEARLISQTKRLGTILVRAYFCSRAEEYAKYGLPKNFKIITKSYFTLGFRSTYSIAWVYEYLTPDMIVGNAQRKKMKYRVDEALPPWARIRAGDYRGTGYVRGHLAAAGNYKFSKKGMQETFLLSNIIPQDEHLNAHYWLSIEKTIRLWLRILPKLHVMTGPLYVYEDGDLKRRVSYQTIGPKRIPVPTHLFKVILGEAEQGRLISTSKQFALSNGSAVAKGGVDRYCQGELLGLDDNNQLYPAVCERCGLTMRAFLVPNRSISRKTSLGRFATTVAKVEKAAGFSFFPKLLLTRDCNQI